MDSAAVAQVIVTLDFYPVHAVCAVRNETDPERPRDLFVLSRELHAFFRPWFDGWPTGL